MPSYQKSPASGLWSVRFREVQADGATKIRRLSKHPLTGEKFRTKKAAQYGYADYLAEKAAAEAAKPSGGTLTPPKNKTPLTALYRSFLAYKKQRTKPSTVYTVQKNIESQILPFFGGMDVEDITPALILDWLGTLSGLSDNYTRASFTNLGALLRFGEKYHGTPNPIKNVDRPRSSKPKPEMEIWTPEEFQKFILYIKEPVLGALFRFFYFSGCRKGEVCALTWADIDLDARTARISKSITAKSHDPGKPYAVTTTKNGKTRVISLPDALCTYLAAYKASLGADATPGAFAFGGSRPIPFTSLDRAFHAAREAAGVKRIRMHDLRHSCASILIHSGVSIVAVSRHLGHRDVEETLNTYAHMIPDDDALIRSAVNAVAEKIDPCA